MTLTKKNEKQPAKKPVLKNAAKAAAKAAGKAVLKPAKPKVEKIEKEKADLATKPVVKIISPALEVDAADAEVDALFENKKSDRYFEATGRRKTSVARVRLFTKGDKSFTVNEKQFAKYFTASQFENIVNAPLEKMNCRGRFTISAKVNGGGINSQAAAIRHGIARALVIFNADFKKRLKKSGYLTRDPRMKERKKFGLKRARRAPQWAKR